MVEYRGTHNLVLRKSPPPFLLVCTFPSSPPLPFLPFLLRPLLYLLTYSIYSCTYICTLLLPLLYMYVCMYICTSVSVCLCLSLRAHRYSTYMHTYMHMSNRTGTAAGARLILGNFLSCPVVCSRTQPNYYCYLFIC